MPWRLVLASGITLAVLAMTGYTGAAECSLIRAGQPTLPLILPVAAGLDELTAAAEWTHVFQKMGSARPRILEEDAVPTQKPAPGVYLGNTAQGRALLALHAPGDVDGFVISVDAGNSTVVIAGATPQATQFAVEWLFEHRAGVDWYFPGKLGEVIPERANWSVADGLTIEAPAYNSRDFAGIGSGDDSLWARRNLLAERFVFIHNLQNVFPPSLYSQHPEFFPLRNGTRIQPLVDEPQGWQPDFANPTVAAYAAEQAKRYFDVHPDAASYSLGLNDGTAFDEGPNTRALIQPARWFRGRPDYSDLVFTFMNRAADDLATAYPEKYLGCLAYYWCENVPTFPVRSQVLPYLTNDRSFYDNAEWAAQDLALIHRWAQSGPKVVGIYDYYYGSPFGVPRIFTTAMVHSLRGASAAGARAFFAELYPVWPYDALKAWLAARLLWDPTEDASVLEAQFYSDLYGPAAEDVRDFFTEAETAWREQAGPPRWIKGYKNPYQALIYSPERTRAMSEMLRRAGQCDLNNEERARLAQLEVAWAASVQMIAATDREALLARDSAQRVSTVAEGLAVAADGLGEGAVCGFYLRAGEWASQHYQRGWLRDVLAVAAKGNNTAALTAQNLWDERGPNLLRNGDFYASNKQAPDDWELRWRTAEHLSYGSVQAVAPGGGAGFAVSGSDWLLLWQDVRAEPGKLYETSFRWRGKVAAGSLVHWAAAYYDAAGQGLEAPWQAAAAPGHYPAWRGEGAVTRAPAEARVIRLMLFVSGQAPGDIVEFARATVAEVLHT
jgi:hypothetical protein